MWSHPQHLGLLGRGWEWKRVCFLTGRPPSFLHSSQEDPKGFEHTQPREWLFGPLRSCLWFLQILFVFQTSWALTYAYVRLIPNSGRVQIHFTRDNCAVCLNEQQGIIRLQPVHSGRTTRVRVGIANCVYSGRQDTYGGPLYSCLPNYSLTDDSINHE